jgi:hypothetical protein
MAQPRKKKFLKNEIVSLADVGCNYQFCKVFAKRTAQRQTRMHDEETKPRAEEQEAERERKQRERKQRESERERGQKQQQSCFRP